MPFRGTILNTLTVLVGSLVGLGIGELMRTDLKSVALSGIGLVVACMGVKMFLETKNVLIPTIAVVSGGLLGAWVGIDVGLARGSGRRSATDGRPARSRRTVSSASSANRAIPARFL